MTTQRFRLEVEDDMYYTIFDNQSTDEEDKLYGLDDEQICELLNAQDKQIFLLKCVIQTITAESMDKNISHKRIMEIKKHWYDKLCGDVE